MRNIFLSSLFSQVHGLFENFAGDSLAGKRVAFIPTAARHEKINFYVKSGMKTLAKAGLIVDELDVSTADYSEISRIIKTNEVIYISGGNTFFLLQELKKSGADQLITEQIESGKLYIGESAGSVILAPDIEYVKALDDCRAAPELLKYASLSVLDFYPLPHYKNFPFQKSVEKVIRDYGTTLPLVPFSNTQAILIGDEKYHVISNDESEPSRKS